MLGDGGGLPPPKREEQADEPLRREGLKRRTALAGGAAGMDVLAPLIASAHTWLAPGGRLVVEIGHRQHDDVLAAAAANAHLGDVKIQKDFEGFWRMLVATRK